MSVKPDCFVSVLERQGVYFFCGVPDSLLKSFCAYITDMSSGINQQPSTSNQQPITHVIAANEGGAVALAAGHYLATGKPALVYMQNSGQGNAVNPLASLADPDVYSIPMVLLIGWRGEPGVHDEPQHVKQGKVTLSLMETLGIPASVIPDDVSVGGALRAPRWVEVVENAIAQAIRESRPVALIVRKGLFESYTLMNRRPDIGTVKRDAVIEAIVKALPEDAVVVSTTGMISRELYETRERLAATLTPSPPLPLSPSHPLNFSPTHPLTHSPCHSRDFLTVGSMGHAIMIALGIAKAQPRRRVICLDGDGASIMQMGNMAIAGRSGCANLCHIVLNNAAHDSVGGQPTLGGEINLNNLAQNFGYTVSKSDLEVSPSDPGTIIEDMREVFADLCRNRAPTFVEFKVAKGARADLGRPKEKPVENKKLFMETLMAK